MQPRNAHAMGATQVAHRRVASTHTNRNHGLVVLMEDEWGFMGQKGLPEVQRGQTLHLKSKGTGHDLGLRGRYADTTLPLAAARHRETCIGTTNRQVESRCGPHC
jgi:hypothetical protein